MALLIVASMHSLRLILFHRSSVVEQSAVNRLVVGSNPTGGAMGELSEWPKEHDWKSCRLLKRSRGFESLALRHYNFNLGPLVKRLRHRPFTAVTRVRIPYGSPLRNIGGLAQLGEHLPYKQGVGGSIPSSSTIKLFKKVVNIKSFAAYNSFCGHKKASLI